MPRGGKSKPMAVIVEVEPGDVIAEVLVIVKVNVLVCELNSQTTVAVENWPEPTPTTLMVSALTVTALNKIRAKRDNATLETALSGPFEPPLNRSGLFGICSYSCEPLI